MENPTKDPMFPLGLFLIWWFSSQLSVNVHGANNMPNVASNTIDLQPDNEP